MLGCAVSAGYLLYAPAALQWLGLAVWLIIYVLIILGAGQLVKKKHSKQGVA